MQWVRKSWQFVYWLQRSSTGEQTLADISMTTWISMCTEVKVKTRAPYRWSLCGLSASHMHNWINLVIFILVKNFCRNPSFGLTTKAKGLQGRGPKGSPGVTSETPRSVGECEGVSLHIPKATLKLGEGVPVDSRNFRKWFEGSNLNGLLRFLYQWKVLQA